MMDELPTIPELIAQVREQGHRQLADSFEYIYERGIMDEEAVETIPLDDHEKFVVGVSVTFGALMVTEKFEEEFGVE